MGYNTTIRCLNNNDEIVIIKSKIEDLKQSLDNNSFCYGLFNEEECSWYERIDEMKLLSENLPNLIIKIEGHGDEKDDHFIEIWLYGNYLHELWKAPDINIMIQKIILTQINNLIS